MHPYVCTCEMWLTLSLLFWCKQLLKNLIFQHESTPPHIHTHHILIPNIIVLYK